MKLTVNDFISIKEAVLELEGITLIIGEQAEGKSLLAKLVSFFLTLIENPHSLINNANSFEDCIDRYKKEFNSRFQYNVNNAFTIVFEISNKDTNSKVEYSIKYDSKNGLQFEIDEKVKEFICKYLKLKKDSKKISARESIIFAVEYESNKVRPFGMEGFRKGIFIDSGRSYFGILQKSWLPLISENIRFADPYLFEFGDTFLKAKDVADREKFRRRVNESSKKESQKILNTLKKKILKGEYRAENGVEYILSSDNRKTPITNTSSGQKETLPIVLILQALISDDIYDYIAYKEIIIEEPESHIFPSTQKDIVDLIGFIFNIRKPFDNFLITTHSPYILTSFNVLLLGGEVYDNGDDEKRGAVEEIVQKECLLRSKQITAYQLKNGILKNLMDKETGLILADGLDKVSEDIGEQFSKLLDLE